MSTLRRLLCPGLLPLLLGVGRAALAQPGFTVGIVPQESPSRLAEIWTPVLSALSQRYCPACNWCSLRRPTCWLRAALSRRRIRFRLYEPLPIRGRQRPARYRALARARGEQIRGLVVVRKDSPVRNLRDLSGTTLAFPRRPPSPPPCW